MSRLVSAGKPGRRVFLSQMWLDAPPRTNCRLVVAMMQLEYAGLRIRERRRFLARLRRATGVPEYDRATGLAQGTTAADLVRALGVMLPWVPVDARLVPDAELLSGLSRGLFTAGVAVPAYNALPGRLARWSPTFSRGHQILLAGARGVEDVPEVLWIDPLGRKPYRGEWVRFSRVKAHLAQAYGRVFATLITKEAGLGTLISPERLYPVPATVTVKRGTPLYTVARDSLELRQAGTAPARLVARTDAALAVRTRPARPPQGSFVRLIDGDLAGRLVRADDVLIVEAEPDAPVDVEAIRAAAIAEGRAAVEAELDEVDEPLYRRIAGEVS